MFSRDGTIALLDQMVGTTTKATARQVTNNGVNPATQAAILAAAAVAQVTYQIFFRQIKNKTSHFFTR